MLSRRTPVELEENRVAATRRAFPPSFDLTVSNPTVCGIAYPSDLLAGLADPAGLTYRPDPRGLATARESVAREYQRHGVIVDPSRVVLTTSTSEAYAFLFKLLCDPGDTVAVPTPSYPLFEHLAQAEAVLARPYRLQEELDWQVDIGDLHAAADLRALIVVHPNNPTGSFVSVDDAAKLVEFAAQRDIALVADEVFFDYRLDAASDPSSFAAGGECLTFTLGGLSKSVGLPQLKLAWILAGGPRRLVTPALERLELIADTFLSVATPVQLALPELLRRGGLLRTAITARCRDNLAWVMRRLDPPSPVSVLPPAGGWSAVLRFPAIVDEETLVVELLRADAVAIQPGYFFDLPRDGYLVTSLLPPHDTFVEGIERVLARLDRYIQAS